MGLELIKVLPNGVPVAYHRINTVQIEVNRHVMLEVFSYPEGARETEQEAEQDSPEVYKHIQWYQLEYDPDMSVNKAYELLKQTDDYQQAVDVIDEWAAGLSYYPDDLCMYQENEYRCIQAHTSQLGWEPPNVPALWAREQDPHDIPEWVQPTGAHDAYALGDKVRHSGKVWESEYDSNIWEPGVYGWREV